MTVPPDAELGFTLVELIVALALFGLIAVAGLALVDSVLGVQARTEGRLDRTADIQRAMYVVSADLQQIAAGPIEGDATRLRFRRAARGTGGLGEVVRYAAGAATLDREVVAPGRARLRHALLTEVSGVRWRYYARGAGWRDAWPASREDLARWPAAVSVEMVVGGGNGPAGTLRRVVELPVHP